MSKDVTRRKFGAIVGSAAVLPILSNKVVGGSATPGGRACRIAEVSSDGVFSEYRVRECGTMNEIMVTDLAGLALGSCANSQGAGCYDLDTQGIGKGQKHALSPSLPDDKLRAAAEFLIKNLEA